MVAHFPVRQLSEALGKVEVRGRIARPFDLVAAVGPHSSFLASAALRRSWGAERP